MPYFYFDNKKVYYQIKGDGDPLLLLHGNTTSSKLFKPVIRMYAREFRLILIDFPGHGKSERMNRFETDFWFYNAKACYALIQELELENINVIGTSGGALVGINLCLEHPENIKYLVADSFEGEYPLLSYVNTIKEDREKDKKKTLARLFWRMNHGADWKQIVDQDTAVNLDFHKTGRSFFHKPISELMVPTLLTGSKKDEYCTSLDEIYEELKSKNWDLDIHLFESGNHPAMLSNKKAFFELIKQKLKGAT